MLSWNLLLLEIMDAMIEIKKGWKTRHPCKINPTTEKKNVKNAPSCSVFESKKIQTTKTYQRQSELQTINRGGTKYGVWDAVIKYRRKTEERGRERVKTFMGGFRRDGESYD
jgi:hypothetical protein